MCCAKKNVLLRSNDFSDTWKRGFVSNEYFYKKKVSIFYDNWNLKYSKEVPIEDIEWFCIIKTMGDYKGYKVVINGESLTTYSIITGIIGSENRVFTKENGFSLFDRQIYAGDVPKREVTNITEIKTPFSPKHKFPDNWDF